MAHSSWSGGANCKIDWIIGVAEMNLLLVIPMILMRGITALRNKLYDLGWFKSVRIGLPVISVGNISAGGNGKTPLTIYLARRLKERGFQPVILTRGYGGKMKGPYVLSGSESASLVGDEPLEMFRTLGACIVVCAKRVTGAKFILSQNLGNVIILDDGFQHRRLARDLDIITEFVGDAEAVQRFCEGQVLPLGRFREDKQQALCRAQILIFADRRSQKNISPIDSRLLVGLPANLKVFKSSVTPLGVHALTDGRGLAPCRVGVFCTIAQPNSFFETLRALAFEIEGMRVFPDHHQITATELNAIRKQFPDLPLVCTSKDAVKIEGDQRQGIYQLSVETAVTPADAFMVQVLRALRDPAQSVVRELKRSL